MKKTVALTAVALVVCAGCGTSNEDSPSDAVPTTAVSTTASAEESSNAHSHGTDAGEEPPMPEVISGESEEAAKATAEVFVSNWAMYRSASQQPRSEWFDSWREMATDDFVQAMRRSFNSMWSWTWNEEKQVLSAEADGPIQVHLDHNTAIARVPVKQHVYGLDARIDEGEEQRKVFDIFLNLSPDSEPMVSNAKEVPEDAPFPPSNRA